MKQYPKIPGSNQAPHKPCLAFVKYDGSNMRFEWTKKRGWFKFGSRTQMIDSSHDFLADSIPLFMNTLAEPLQNIFKKHK